MAEQHINLRLGSTADTSGFTKVNNALTTLGKNVQKANTGIASISGSLGGLNGVVGKVSGGISNLFTSFAGGPIGITIGAITTIISLFTAWKKHSDELKEKHEKLVKEMHEGYGRRVASYIQKAIDAQNKMLDNIITKGNRAIDVLNRMRDGYKALTNSDNDKINSKLSLGNSIIDKNVAEQSLKITQSTADPALSKLLIGVVKAKAEQEKTTQGNQVAIDISRNNMSVAEEEVKRLHDLYQETEKVRDAKSAKGEDTFKEDEKLIKTYRELSIAQDKLKISTEQHDKLLNDVRTKNIQMAVAVHEAEEAIVKYKQSLQEQIKALQDQVKEKKKQLESEKKTAELKTKIDEVDKKILSMKQDAEKKQKERESFEQNLRDGMSADNNQRINGRPYQYHPNENGVPDSDADQARAQRFAGKRKREKDNRDNFVKRRDDAREKQLRNTKRSQWSKSDWDFMARRNKQRFDANKAKEEIAKEEKRKKDLELELKKQRDENHDNIATITTEIQNLNTKIKEFTDKANAS